MARVSRTRSLGVWMNAELTGHWSIDSMGRHEFRYEESWVKNEVARPISLSVRLFANMTAGHTVLAVLFGLAMSASIWIGWMPFGFTVIINGLEIAIAFIQAYIFTILTCVYIGDVVKLH